MPGECPVIGSRLLSDNATTLRISACSLEPLLLLLNMRGPETCSYEFITSHGLQRHVLQLVV